MTPQRIAYVLKIFPKLSETFIAGELAELRRRGIEVRILSLLPPREELRHEIITRAGLDKLTIYGPEKFSGALKDFKPQVLHAHFATESTAAAWELAEEFRLPFTFTAHGYDIHRKPPADFGQRTAAASAVITVSEANAKHIAKTFGVTRERLHVISCGVDTDWFRPDATQRDGKPLILCVARLVKVKNLDLLLRACSLLRDRAVKFGCVMIGDGPCRDELQTLRAELRLDGLVEMPGAVEQGEVLKWWQRASVGVLTSENEGMPVSLMEAAACGVPVVATAVGGVPELVGNRVTGLLVPPGDVEALACALEGLLNDPQLATVMGIASRRLAEERFSVRRQVDKLLALWSEILDGGAPE